MIGARTIDLMVDEFGVGEELIVKAQHVWGDDTLGKFDCRVESGGRCVAAAVLTVFQGDPGSVRIGRAEGA